jgi:hypothetical protein
LKYFWSLFVNFDRDLHVLVARRGFLKEAFIFKVMVAKIIVTALARVRMHFKLFPA